MFHFSKYFYVTYPVKCMYYYDNVISNEIETCKFSKTKVSIPSFRSLFLIGEILTHHTHMHSIKYAMRCWFVVFGCELIAIHYSFQNYKHWGNHTSSITAALSLKSLQWRHNWHDSVSNHQPHDCLLKRLFRRRSKKTSKLRVTGLCEENSLLTDEFPSQRASNAENVSIL